MGDFTANPEALAMVGGFRVKDGAVRQADGTYRDEDVEAVISLQMGCARASGLIGPRGQRGMMVPVGEVSRSLAELYAEAAKRMGAMETQEQDAREAARGAPLAG